MFCKNCTCQSCTDNRNLIEREYIKITLSISTENRDVEEVMQNRAKGNDLIPKYDVLTATLVDNRTFSVRFNNFKGQRDGFLYRICLFLAKKNLCAQVRMITNKKPVIVFSIKEDLLDYIKY